MKKLSRRARRMERHHKLRKSSGLNMISLMDIFTILVFFLLVNSSSSQQLPSQKDLKLPVSTAQKAPKETLLLVITPKSLLVQGREITSLHQLAVIEGDLIEPLQKELEFQAGQSTQKSRSSGEKGRAITIIGDENLSYEVLRKVLATCQSANYTDIAFAAMQVSKSNKGV